MKLVRYEYPTVSRADLVNSLFEQALNDFARVPSFFDSFGFGSRAFAPLADLHEDTNNFYARFELPGVKKDQVKVELENAVLTVSVNIGEKSENGSSAYATSRSISIPDGVDADKVKAKLEDGILTITLAKAESRKPKAIEVR